MMEEIRKLYEKFGGEVKEFEKFEGEVDVGYKIEFEKKIEDVDVHFFGLASGDLNPIHFDEEVASKTKFKGRVVHGMLTTSLVSAAVARMPGIVVLLEACFKYTKPVRIGDTVKVVGEVVEKEKNRYKLDVKCFVGENVVAEGYAKVLLW
ncbi:MaoC domain protein dehydratase [Ferroglobus placidus DSM 10642]|uniref:MaoC domain protein dehydratase n=1 Tax=Ferroglobus placidus (strain DSM 10642 / AEDII12DO) TaxID=589924 RepID=D3RYK1_FERPA|nr:MaoC/PaaZ C-terminal domain-containing protein [Ferroglobus placidus]ADC65564.1 MaoC domain protein dehydratase [Ferroglobus placidus DSM 10642]